MENTSVKRTGSVLLPVERIVVSFVGVTIVILLPIVIGSFRLLKQRQEKRENGHRPNSMSYRDAAMNPLISSIFLLIGYYLSGSYIMHVLLSGLYLFVGIYSLWHFIIPFSPSVLFFVPNTSRPYNFTPVRNTAADNIGNQQYVITSHDFICLASSFAIVAWYQLTKNWIANNILAIAIAVTALEMRLVYQRPTNVVTGCILLTGLLMFDVLWVFGFNVMEIVCASFEIPNKLMFPQELFEAEGKGFAVLGLGDIIHPGVFIAHILRFDASLNRESKFYFWTTLIAYVVGFMATTFAAFTYKHAQPALLYLVPACLGTPLFLALVRGDLTAMLEYEDFPEKSANVEKKDE